MAEDANGRTLTPAAVAAPYRTGRVLHGASRRAESSVVLSSLPLPVVIVAAAAGGERSCSTATLTYVSLEPPLVAVPMSARGRTTSLVRRSGELSVSLLDRSQAELAVRAARRTDGDKFAEQDIPVLAPPPGAVAPAVAGCSALWCGVVGEHPHGAAILFVGEIRAHADGGVSPLVRFRRRYHALGESIEVAAEAPYPL
jgi:flavin reductase (DIM6/NTAB) family NADH-FMN oxidoreductase RutF